MIADYENIVVLFLMIALGFLLTKRGLFTADTGKLFSSMVLKVALPFEVFLKISTSLDRSELVSLAKNGLIPLIFLVILFFISLAIAKLVKIPNQNIGMFTLNFTTSSTAFLGLPIAMTFLGDKATPYALIFYLVFSFLFWSFGVLMVNRDAEIVTGKKEKIKLGMIIKNIFNLIIISFILALTGILLQLKLPNIVVQFSQYIGDLTTPLALMFIGITISTAGFKKLKVTKSVIWVLIGRYLVAPVLVLLVARVLGASTMMTKVSFIMAVLPTGNGSVVLAEQKGVDVTYATTAVIYSILMYIVYLPIVIAILHWI